MSVIAMFHQLPGCELSLCGQHRRVRGWHVSTFTASATLLGYAYENTPGVPINAGQTKDGYYALVPGPANPESFDLVASVTNPAQAVSLDTRALGAQQVPLRRKKEPFPEVGVMV